MSDLHNAIRNNDISLIKDILTNASSNDIINQKDALSRTPLHLAAWKGSPEMIQLLLNFHASTKIKAKDNFNPLHFAIQSGNLECCKLLLQNNKHLLSERINKGNKTALHLAVQKGNYEIIEFLLNSGADPTALTNQRQTALEMTSNNEIFQLIKERIEKKIENDKNKIKKRSLESRETLSQTVEQSERIFLTEDQLEDLETQQKEQTESTETKNYTDRSSQNNETSTLYSMSTTADMIGPQMPPTDAVALPTPPSTQADGIGPQMIMSETVMSPIIIEREEKIVKIDFNQKKKKQRLGIRLSHLEPEAEGQEEG